jgi:hypothetical protein
MAERTSSFGSGGVSPVDSEIYHPFFKPNGEVIPDAG